MLALRITAKAAQQIRGIGIYTQQQWGEDQRRRYLNDLDQRILWLKDNWELGSQRDAIKTGCRAYHHARHIIFYRTTDTTLEIIGILHESMDYKKHLQ